MVVLQSNLTVVDDCYVDVGEGNCRHQHLTVVIMPPGDVVPGPALHIQVLPVVANTTGLPALCQNAKEH